MSQLSANNCQVQTPLSISLNKFKAEKQFYLTNLAQMQMKSKDRHKRWSNWGKITFIMTKWRLASNY